MSIDTKDSLKALLEEILKFIKLWPSTLSIFTKRLSIIEARMQNLESRLDDLEYDCDPRRKRE